MDTSMNYESSGYGKKPAWFWLLIYLVAGGIVYAGYYYYAGYQKTPGSMMYASPTPSATGADSTMMEQTQGKEFKVEIKADGYFPASLTVAVGDTVTWTHSSDKPSNVSSDPHPSHTTYPPLNLGMIKPEESKSLTFDKAGTYGYHNHLNSTQTGTIIVK